MAPIAFYPDPLLGQVLVASTYSLELVQLQQWPAKNPSLKDKALADAVAKQPWTWSHNPQHRGGAPHANQATANIVESHVVDSS